MSRIEVLRFEQPQREQSRVRTFLRLFREVPLGNEIAEETISVRREHSIEVPDAIIAATALELDVPLVTRNTSDFKSIGGLALRNPFDD